MSRPSKGQRKKGRRNTSLYAVAASVGLVAIVVVAYYALAQSPAKVVVCPTGLTCAKIFTSLGVFEIELFQAQTPKTVANFVSLAKSGFYDNLVWHRIEKGFVIQTGDPITRNGAGNRSFWGTGSISQTVPLEINSSLHNYAGYLGMAKAQNQNGSCQFFINLVNNTFLDGHYTVFGKVISGFTNVVLAIGDVPVNPAKQPINPVFMTNVTVLSSGS
jgi:cyclophilin family peptidyl-prolyl cis-trans isomerase